VVVGRLQNDLATPDNIRSFSSALKNLDQTSQQLNLMASQNRAAITETVKDLNQLVSPNRGKLDSTVRHLARASANLDSISDKINSGQGTAGQLVNDKELYQELKKTNRQLQDLIADIKTNPRKYLTVEIF
jgi:phospholipid/cholesterol/gamma-HCH transport system substrate-binding protein